MASPTDNHFETGRSGKHATMHRSHSLQSQVTLQNGLYFAAALRSHVASQGVIEAGTDRKRNSQRASRYLSQELDSAGARIPLALCCFLSGCEWLQVVTAARAHICHLHTRQSLHAYPSQLALSGTVTAFDGETTKKC